MKETSHRNRLIVFALILGLVVVARYWRFPAFGLCGDLREMLTGMG